MSLLVAKLYGFVVRPGIALGATEDFGLHAVTEVVNHYDYHATLLHLFGLDHRRLMYTHNNQQLTLTDNQPVRVVGEILAWQD